MIPADAYRALLDEAVALHRQGRLGEAEQRYRRLLDFDLLHLFGILRAQQGHHQEALDLMGAALQADNRSPAALANRGDVLITLSRHAEAVAHYEAALNLTPDNPALLNQRGVALLRMGRHQEALDSFDTALAIAPNHVEPLINRGSALHELERFSEALENFDRALALAADSVSAREWRGTSLTRLGRIADALADFDRALALDAGNASVLTNRGIALREVLRTNEALADFIRAMALDPTCVNAFWNAGVTHLLMGNFAEGWPLYEWRKRLPEPIDADTYPAPQWQGEDLAGKTLFLHSGQGLGDTIQFFRFALMADRLGARVILSAQDCLRRLLETAAPQITFMAERSMPAAFDFHAPLMSLPLAFGVTLDGIPAPVPYLRAEPERAASWRARLGTGGFRVGIAWQGKPGVIDEGRSIALREFAPLAAIPGVRLISLQKGLGSGQLADADFATETLGADFDSGPDAFLDSAAVMQSLDLVITSDTAIAHLAGALGRPAWVALKYLPEWRWMLSRPDSPWYPTLRLFRQQAPGDWGGVFATMARELQGQSPSA
ncbi:MAG TPA: tetratricopeptide repeat protein [Rhizomicrobium sp.]|jgi:tetratricopeptide (TPR) repeat protein